MPTEQAACRAFLDSLVCDMNQLLAEVLALEHALEGVNGIFQAFGNSFPVFQFTGSDP